MSLVVVCVLAIYIVCGCAAENNFQCVCSLGEHVTVPVYGHPDANAPPIGTISGNECIPSFPDDTLVGFRAVGFNNTKGYVKLTADVRITVCTGSRPFQLTTHAPATTPHTTTPVTTTHTPTTQTTTTTTTTPASTTKTDTSTTSSTLTSVPEGHTELCPKGIQTDIGISHGYVGQYGNYCYEYVPTSTQWGHAERHCKIVSSGHLTSIMNDHEQAFILKFLASHGHSDPVWIGLTDSDAEGTWEWTSGEAVTYKHFQTLYQMHTTKDHKLNDCIVLKSNGEWTDIACGVTLAIGFGLGEHHSFVCQYNLTSHPPSVFGDGILNTLIG